MSKELLIYCASDDLVEFEGAITEEFNIYRWTEFDVTATSPNGDERSFGLEAEFGYGWGLKFCYYGEDDEEDFPESPWTGVEFGVRGKNNDPYIRVPLRDDETVVVELVSDP